MESDRGPTEPDQLELFNVQEYVDRLYEAGDKAAHLIMSQMVDVIHDRYGPLGDPRSIATGDEW